MSKAAADRAWAAFEAELNNAAAETLKRFKKLVKDGFLERKLGDKAEGQPNGGMAKMVEANPMLPLLLGRVSKDMTLRLLREGEIKHLPGRHDQRTHGMRAGVGQGRGVLGAGSDKNTGLPLDAVHKASPEAKKAHAELIKLADQAPVKAQEKLDAELEAINKALDDPKLTEQGLRDLVLREERAYQVLDHAELALRDEALKAVQVETLGSFKTKYGDPAIDTEGVYEFKMLVNHPDIKDQQVVLKANNRDVSSWYNPNTEELHVSTVRPGLKHQGAVVHELGHWMTDRSERTKKAEMEYAKERNRTGGRSPYQYDGHWMYPDSWNTDYQYTGKVYQGRKSGATYATEVVSQGLQRMFENPIDFAKRDPDHFAFTYDYARGKV